MPVVGVIDLVIAIVGLVAGALVGLTSIGGVLVLPALVILLGLSPHAAIPAAMVAFIVPSVLALLIAQRRGQFDLGAGAALWGGAMPGAFLGAALLPWIPVGGLLWAIVAMLALSALRVFIRPQAVDRPETAQSGVELGLLGVVVGAISALTGTGGPMTLMPILGWRGVGARRAVMLCQTITLPITIFASLGYALGLPLDWRLVILLAGATTLGVLLGARAAPHVPVPALARLIGVLMAVVAAILAARQVFG